MKVEKLSFCITEVPPNFATAGSKVQGSEEPENAPSLTFCFLPFSWHNMSLTRARYQKFSWKNLSIVISYYYSIDNQCGNVWYIPLRILSKSKGRFSLLSLAFLRLSLGFLQLSLAFSPKMQGIITTNARENYKKSRTFHPKCKGRWSLTCWGILTCWGTTSPDVVSARSSIELRRQRKHEVLALLHQHKTLFTKVSDLMKAGWIRNLSYLSPHSPNKHWRSDEWQIFFGKLRDARA